MKIVSSKIEKLALLGGKPVLNKLFPRVYNIGKEEIIEVVRILKRGPLSGFLASAGPGFLGGEEVRKFESAFAKKFKVKHAVSFNSATTALQGAMAALGIGPGDEVIVPPFTMSASATAVLMNGAVPIFADIDERTFCLDPKAVRERITKCTKAIVVVNLFGGPADMDGIMEIAKEHNLKVVEDNAQAPGAKYKGRYAGTIGDVGVFSFNVHKTIQAGEGGVLVTNDYKYALRAQLCRNHGEAVTVDMPDYHAGPIMGSNYRMSEVHAVIASEQLKKLNFLNQERVKLVKYLTEKLKGTPGIITPYVMPQTKHVFYMYPIKIDERVLGISRDRFANAMAAEGFPMSKGYVKPIYLLPIFQERKVFNQTRFTFESNYCQGKPDYSKGICPVCERMQERELMLTDICQYPRTKRHIDLFVKAVEKVIKYKSELE